MGADAIITVPFGTTAGSGYTVLVYGVGYNGNTNGYETQTVTVTVTGAANNPPVATNDTASTSEDSVTANLHASLLSNDSDGGDGGALNITAVNTTGTTGSVTFEDATDTVTYNPNGQYESLAVGESTTDSFGYTLSDGIDTDTATVTVTINGVNDPPTADTDSASTSEDSATANLHATLLTGDTDPDASDTLDITAVDTTGTTGSVTFDDATDTVIYNPNGQFESLAVGESTTDTFDYTVSDGNGGTSSNTVTITINGANDGPTANDDSGAGFSTTQDTVFTTGNVLTNDTDPDTSDTLSVSTFDAASTQGGTVSSNADGTFNYTPPGGYSGNDTFTYTASDGNGGTSSATVTINVTAAVNNPPVATNDTASTDEDSVTANLHASLLSNDSDGGDGGALDITAVNTTGITGTVTFNDGTNTLTYDPNGQFESLAVGESTTDSFGYTLSDGIDTDTAAVTVTINGANDSPTASDDSGAGFSTTQDTAFTTGNVLTNDTDPDTTDTLSVSAFDAASTQGGTVSSNGDGTFDYTPPGGYSGNDTFTYTASDGNGGTNSATVTISISAAANQPPTDITLTPDRVTDGTDTSGGFDMTLGAVDPDGGESFTFTKTGAGADQAVFSISANTLTLTDGIVSYDTPTDANSDRVYEVEVQVEDSAANTYSETLLVTITPAYNPMIHSSLSTGSSKWGGDWGTATGKYGEFTCNTCHARGTGNIKRVKTTIAAPNGTDEFPIQTDSGTITFNSTTGAGSFGDDAGGHLVSDKICEGCHSQNLFHNYNSANNLANGGDLNHENQKDCIDCHKHSNGFGASCDTCHGNPPVTANFDSTGLVFDPSTTDATNPASPGAHELHAVTEGMSCSTCHKGNTMPTVSMTIQMGFEASPGSWSQLVGSASGGNLDAPDDTAGQMSASYEFISSDGGATTITKVASNDLNCTVYCHGDWTGSGGSNTTPSWVGGTGEASCGSCHGAAPASPPTAGSHQRHAGNGTGEYNLACTRCHPTVADQTHLNASVSWELDTAYNRFGASATYRGADAGSTSSAAPSATYGQCDSVYCHSSGQGIADPTNAPVYQTPTWGDTYGATCANACHNVGYSHNSNEAAGYAPLTSGSHATHLKYHFNQDGSCASCHHDYAYEACGDCHARSGHVDHSISVAFDPDFPSAATSTGGAYSGDTIPGNAYGGCSSLYCHSQGTAADAPYAAPNTSGYSWGGTLPADCTGCHSGDAAAVSSMSTASHGKHLSASLSTAIDCSQCHALTVDNSRTLNTTTRTGDQTNGYYYHSNGWINVAFDSFADPGSSATYDGNASGYAFRAPGSTPGDCDNIYCHSSAQGNIDPTNPPVYNTPTWGGTIDSRCKACHKGGVHPTDFATDPPMSTGSHSEHVEYTFGISGAKVISCQACHYLGEALACTPCHGSPHDPANFTRLDKHVDGSIDVDFNPSAAGASASYTGDAVPQTAYGSCDNTYCHSNGTSVATGTIPAQSTTAWGSGGLSCSDCHDGPATGPTYANGTPKANSHSAHASYDCIKCHSATVDASDAIIDKSVHVNLTYDVSGTDIGSYTFNAAGGTCSNITCHFNGSAQWGDTLGCADCHGNPPNTNAHLTHAGSGAGEYGLACSTCHPEDHDGTAEDITFSGAVATQWGTETYNATNMTCSSLYCHGSAAADWDGGTGGACGDCHGAATTGRPDGANEPSGGSHLTTSHQVACTNCHSHDGTDTTEHVNGEANTAGDALVSSAGTNVTSYTYGTELASSPDPDGYKYSGGTCATSCHSNATWGGTGGCTFCHGGSGLYYPQTSTAPDRAAEHAAHIYALETKLGYTHGTTVDAEQKAMCAYCHNDADGIGGIGHSGDGDAAVGDFNPMWNGATADADGAFDQGVTDTCSNIDCHYSTTTADSWYGTGDADCAYCHADGVATYTAGDLPNVHDKHVDETADSGYNMTCAICHDSSGYAQDHANGGSGTDVTFTGAVATQWGTESYSAAQKQCSNLYCHGAVTADWDAGTGGACGDCHGAAGTGRPDGVDEPSGGSHLTGSHVVACTNCHSHDGTDKVEHVNGDTGHTTGDALVSSAGSSITSYTYGSTLASSPDPDGYKYSGGTCANSCHGTLDWGGTASCDTCHNGTGSGYSKVSVDSPHSTTATGMTCEACHFSDHGSRTTDTVGITWYAQTMGTDYTVDGMIYIVAYNSATQSVPTTEAESCWNCHEAQTPDVSEWDGSSAIYDYGSVTTNDLNWFTTTWASANFDYKDGVLSSALGSSASTHGTMGGAAGVDQESEVSCTRCHDVHAVGNNGYTAGAAPYLRGTWKSSPYYEDGAPGRYTGTGGSGTSTYVGNGSYGIVPRASDSTTNGMGGYWIDQNSGSPTNGTYADHAGLCTLCHGNGDATPAEAADITAIETIWVGHKNTVAGGNDDSSAARNIFSTGIRIGDGVWNSNGGGLYMGAQNIVTYRDTKGYAGSIRNDDYNDGVSPTVVGKAYAFNDFAWGVNVDNTSVDSNYHSFTCSKCHNPHASRLPKLMITNCLDVSQNTWDDAFTGDTNWGNNNYSSQTYGTNELAKASTAQNCHRYIDNNGDGDGIDAGDEPGWNSVTPW